MCKIIFHLCGGESQSSVFIAIGSDFRKLLTTRFASFTCCLLLVDLPNFNRNPNSFVVQKKQCSMSDKQDKVSS